VRRLVYKYTPIGMNLGRTIGKISYLHDNCAMRLNATLGPKAVPFEGEIPSVAKCPWCGRTIGEKNRI